MKMLPELLVGMSYVGCADDIILNIDGEPELERNMYIFYSGKDSAFYAFDLNTTEIFITHTTANPFALSHEDKLTCLDIRLGGAGVEEYVPFDMWVTAHLCETPYKYEPSKKWRYELTTNVIWANFDNGVVTAPNEEIAREKAIKQLTHDLKIINDKLKGTFELYMDLSAIEIYEEK